MRLRSRKHLLNNCVSVSVSVRYVGLCTYMHKKSEHIRNENVCVIIIQIVGKLIDKLRIIVSKCIEEIFVTNVRFVNCKYILLIHFNILFVMCVLLK